MLTETHIFSGSLVHALAWEAGRKQDGKDAKAQRLRKLRWDWSCPVGALPSKGQSVGWGGPPRAPWSPWSRDQFTNASLVGSCSKLPSRIVPMGLTGRPQEETTQSCDEQILTLPENTAKSLRNLLKATHVGWGLQIVTGANELLPG